ncbi:MAG: hypothetical protein KF836_05520 [Fimbriimonadaceae bacterium]|nr:hypothetical protein [Fimbriimonadaceae bacterium]
MSIPRIAHFTSHKAVLPEDEQFVVDEFKRLHPDWEVKIWNDEMNAEAFKRHLPEHAEMILKLPHGVLRADIARYLFLKQDGGWYFDTDYQVLQNLDQYSDYDLILPISWAKDDPSTDYAGLDKYCNSVMASILGHPFWDTLLAESMNRLKTWPVALNMIEELTGPDLVTQVAHSHPEVLGNHWMPAQPLFHPRLAGYPVKAEDYPDAYGAHWCKGGWRDLSFMGRVKRRLARMRKSNRVRNFVANLNKS